MRASVRKYFACIPCRIGSAVEAAGVATYQHILVEEVVESEVLELPKVALGKDLRRPCDLQLQGKGFLPRHFRNSTQDAVTAELLAHQRYDQVALEAIHSQVVSDVVFELAEESMMNLEALATDFEILIGSRTSYCSAFSLRDFCFDFVLN